MKVKSRSFQFCILVLLFLSAHSDELNCLRHVGGGFFDLTALERNTDYNITNIDPNKPDIYMQYNVCRFSTKQCHSKFAFANLYSTNEAIDCLQLSNITRYEGIQYSLIDPERIGAGIQILFTGGDTIDKTIGTWSPVDPQTRATKPTSTYNFAINFICNTDVADYNVVNYTFDANTFTYTVNMETTHGCPLLTLDQVSQFIDDNKIVFCIVGCILGLLLAFLGLKLFLPTLFLAGFVSGFFVCLFTFFGVVLAPDSRESTKWILVAFAIVLGCALGYITVKANKFGIFIIGAWLGVIISLILYNAVLYKIHTDPAEIVLLVTIGVLGLLGGLLSLKFYKHVVIVSTSLGGSYAFVRALSLVIGGFPNEIKLINEIQLQNYDFSVEWPFYVYMNAIFLMTLFSIWVQIKIKRRAEANELEFDAEYFKKVDI